MKVLSKLAGLLAFFTGCLVFGVRIESRAQELPKIDAGSLLRQLKRSYEGVRSYDVLQSLERKSEGEGVSETLRFACRVAFDPDLERLACISIAEKVDDNNRQVSCHSKVTLVRDGVVMRSDFDKPTSRFKSRSFEEHFKEADIPNVFLIGAKSYPSGEFSKDYVTECWDAAIGRLTAYGEVSLAGKSIEVVTDIPIAPTRLGPASVQRRYRFDARTSLPTSYSRGHVIEAEDRTIKQVPYRSSISWCEPAPGLFLPETMVIHQTGVLPDESTEKRFIKVARHSTLSIDWYSVNEEIDEDLWDPEKIMDFEAVNRLCNYPLKGK